MSEFKVGDRVSLLDNAYYHMARNFPAAQEPFTEGKPGVVEVVLNSRGGAPTVVGVRLDDPEAKHPLDGWWSFYEEELSKDV